MRIAPKIHLSEDEHQTLTKWSRGRSTPARLVQRANIILLAAQEHQNKDIAKTLGVMERTVGRWRSRFAQDGLTAIEKDLPRGGRHATERGKYEAAIIKKVQEEKPENATHWSTREIASGRDKPKLGLPCAARQWPQTALGEDLQDKQ